MKETLTHHAIKASRIEDAHGPAILLEQDDTTEAYSVIVHPWQLLAVCQHFGLIAGTGEAQKAIRTLQRRLLALDDRIQGLLRYMADCSDHDHADLSSEMERLQALADLSGEWIAEMQDVAEEGAVKAEEGAVNAEEGAVNAEEGAVNAEEGAVKAADES